MTFREFEGLFRWKFFTIAKIVAVVIPIMFYLQLNFNLDQPRLNPVLLKSLKLLNRSKRSGLFEPPIEEPIQIIELVPDRYWIYKRRANWFLADELCEKDSRVLAAFVTKEEAILVIDKIYSISHFSVEYDWKRRKEEMGLDRNYWMGLFDLGHEGKWEWNHDRGFLAYQDMWTEGQPDHRDANGNKISNRDQHCGGLWNPIFHLTTPENPIKHSFDDKECTHELYFICQNIGTRTMNVNNTHVHKIYVSSEEKAAITTEPMAATPAPIVKPKPRRCVICRDGYDTPILPARCEVGSIYAVCRPKNKCEHKACVAPHGNKLLDKLTGHSKNGIKFCADCVGACRANNFPDVHLKCKQFCEKNKNDLFAHCYHNPDGMANVYDEHTCNEVKNLMNVKEDEATSKCK